MIHIADHICQNSSGKVLLTFVDSNMIFMNFSKWVFKRRFYCSFLNCCSTFELTSGSRLLNSNCTILHNRSVVLTVACDFVEHFNTVISSCGDLNCVWQVAFSNCIENQFSYKYF